MKKLSIDDMAAFCKRKGFVMKSGEIYGGFAGFWDYLSLGVELKNNIKQAWWDFHVREREDMEGIDGSIITHPDTWKASGHVDSFVDIAVVCKKCKNKTKVDKHELGKIKCEKCGGEFESKGEFNPMFTTQVGPVREDSTTAYLRPETAQLIFTNFKSVFEGARMKLPCGIAQIGKAYRNEIAPRNFLFRCREFEQMEIEYFIKPKQKCPFEIPDVEVLVLKEGDSKGKKMTLSEAHKKKIIKKDWHAYWLGQGLLWFKNLGADLKNFRIRQHDKKELSHYSSDTWDLEYNFPFGWKELQGIADRGDYDLSQHEKLSKTKMQVLDEETKEKFIPHVICEPSFGVERALLVFLYEAYKENEKGNVVLNLSPILSPIKAAIFPLMKKGEQADVAKEIYNKLKKKFNVNYDVSGSVGRRYARNDEIGTPFCLTIDDQTLEDKTVTIRDRDTTEQKRIKISDLKIALEQLISGEKTFKDI
jgi:glycyl-tRNA synthetase